MHLSAEHLANHAAANTDAIKARNVPNTVHEEKIAYIDLR